MAGTKLLNCFVKLKDTSTYNGYFRVIRQDESLCTILNLDDKCIKLHTHTEELKKVKDSKSQFLLFCRYMEALVAYRKFSGRDE